MARFKTKQTKGEIKMKKGKEMRKKYYCKKCKVKTNYAYGIGEYCPKCGRDWGLCEA
jgi:hypothetical protein